MVQFAGRLPCNELFWSFTLLRADRPWKPVHLQQSFV